ncbi:MAG: TolC family protein [Planctomycetia bacterium]|nr:TolC family protein [Planctomycetia bacterium]
MVLAMVLCADLRAQAPKQDPTLVHGDDNSPQLRVTRLPPTFPQRRFEGVQVSAAVQPTIEPAPSADRAPEPIPSGQEDSTQTTTLDELAQVALSTNPAIREAETRAMAARGLAIQARLYPNPTMGTASPQLAGNQSQYNAYMIQDLVTKGKIGLDSAAAERAAREAELALVRARFEVLTTVRQRFYTVLVSQQRVDVLGAMVIIARKSADIGRQLLKAGFGSRGDLLLLQIELSRAETELNNAITLLATSKRQLAAATGLIDTPIDRLRGDLKQPLPNYELIAVQQGVIQRNALARSAEIEIARSQIVLRRAEVEPFPNINFMGGYQNQQPGAFAPQAQALYQVQMVVPLFNRNQGNIRAAQAGVGTAVAQLNRIRVELANTTAAALGRYLTAQQSVERYEKEILPNAVEVQGIMYELYARGQFDFLRYLAAQRALVDANLLYLNYQEARWTAAAEVAGLLQSERFP